MQDFKVPLGWSVKTIKDFGACITGTTPKTKNPEYYSSPDYDFISPADLGEDKYIYDSQKKISFKGLQVSRPLPRNSILCVCIGSSIGKVGLSFNKQSATNQQINAIVCNADHDPIFIYYLLLYYSEYWKNFATFSTVPILNKGKFKEIEVPCSDDIEEQRKIAAVLSLVQEAIRQQEQLITTTTELKKATMQKLFTEGTRGEPQKMTEIGLIPESWDVVSLGKVAKIGNGATPKKDNPEYWKNGSIPWLTSTKIHESIITEADFFVTQKAVDECHLPLVPKGSLLVAITGQGKTLGNSALVKFNTRINQHLAYIRFNDSAVIPTFVLAFLQSRYEYLRQIAKAGGSTKAALTCGLLKMYEFPLPNNQEEQLVTSQVFSSLNKKISIYQNNILLLQDLFKTLLHQLMTAQIRVDDLDISALNLELQGGKQDALI